jgi:alginate O-acetyltransferase complex protein AlgJ
MSFDRLRIALFLLCLTLPLAGYLLGLRSTPESILANEKRLAAETPRWPGLSELPEITTQIEDYWNDYFGFRMELVGANNRFQAALPGYLGSVTDDPRVLIGEDGWYFLWSQENILEQYLGQDLWDADERALWMRGLENLRTYLEADDTRFLFVLLPNKHSVYSEHLPAWARRRGAVTQYDQVLGGLAENGRIEHLGMLETLLRAKRLEERPIYYRTDSHWNLAGAYRSYLGIAARLEEMGVSLDPVLPDEVKRWYEPRPNKGDLILMMGPQIEAEDEEARFQLLQREAPADGAKVLVVHDSYTDIMVPFLDRSFGVVTYLPVTELARFEALYLETRPDVVVWILVERLLNQPLLPQALQSLPAAPVPPAVAAEGGDPAPATDRTW